ncbi:MAG: phage antirepressor [Bifidobacterium adolescentis]|nr:phage antirepressor [Bifidobacterium adolescentis]
MNNEIRKFDFRGASLRTLTDGAGEPWFVLKDCMSILDLGNPTETVKMFDKDEFSTTEVIDSIGRRQQTYIISEPGLYRLVMRSRKPEAKEFQRWVTHEVLPQIRKTGGYIPTTDADDDMTILAKAVMIGQRTMEAQKQNGMDIGQNPLFRLLQADGYLGKSGSNRNVPTQRAMDLGLFRIKETTVTHADGHTTVSRTPKVTGKGQTYFTNLFLKPTLEAGA